MYHLLLQIITENPAVELTEVARGAKNCLWEGYYTMIQLPN